MCIREIQQGVKRLVHFSRFMCGCIYALNRVFTGMGREGTVRMRQTAGVNPVVVSKLQKALCKHGFFSSVVLAIRGYVIIYYTIIYNKYKTNKRILSNAKQFNHMHINAGGSQLLR